MQNKIPELFLKREIYFCKNVFHDSKYFQKCLAIKKKGWVTQVASRDA